MRLKSLDSLRGLAAFVVVLHHCVLTLPSGGTDWIAFWTQGLSAPIAWLYLTPFRLLVAGPAAVLIFFVLSGMVLAMTFVHRGGDRYASFLIKRAFRIWPPFAAAIIFSAILAFAVGSAPVTDASRWFTSIWSEPIGVRMLLAHLLMVGSSTSLDNPMWSLIHEMRISIIFPLLVAATIWNWRIIGIVAIIIPFVCTQVICRQYAPGWLHSIAMTATFLFLFTSGITLSLHFQKLREILNARSAYTHVFLWMLALFALLITPGRTDTVYGYDGAMRILIGGAGATMIVMLCAVEGRVLTTLLGRIPTYLGRISYSLYLIHVVVIAAVVHATASIISVEAALVIAVTLSIALADLGQRFVEAPAAIVGKHLSDLINRCR